MGRLRPDKKAWALAAALSRQGSQWVPVMHGKDLHALSIRVSLQSRRLQNTALV